MLACCGFLLSQVATALVGGFFPIAFRFFAYHASKRAAIFTNFLMGRFHAQPFAAPDEDSRHVRDVVGVGLSSS